VDPQIVPLSKENQKLKNQQEARLSDLLATLGKETAAEPLPMTEARVRRLMKAAEHHGGFRAKRRDWFSEERATIINLHKEYARALQEHRRLHLRFDPKSPNCEHCPGKHDYTFSSETMVKRAFTSSPPLAETFRASQDKQAWRGKERFHCTSTKPFIRLHAAYCEEVKGMAWWAEFMLPGKLHAQRSFPETGPPGLDSLGAIVTVFRERFDLPYKDIALLRLNLGRNRPLPIDMDTIAREATAVRRAYADHQRTPRSP
jgi:hypothetical protein